MPKSGSSSCTAAKFPQLSRTLKTLLPAKTMNGPICMPAWPKKPEKKVLTKSLSCLNLSAKLKKGHEERYQALLDSLCEGKIFERPTKVIWECANCGHRVESPKAPEKCPVCDHPQAYFFELQEEF